MTKRLIKYTFIVTLLIYIFLPIKTASASLLRKQTKEAFQNYTAAVETELNQRAVGTLPFIQSCASPNNKSLLLNGQMVITRLNKDDDTPGGIIHDWLGAIFYPHASLNDVASILLDYDSHERIFSEVIDSKILTRSGQAMTVYLRFKKKEILTVVTDTYHNVIYCPISEGKAQLYSRSTRINEVENSGEDNEKILPEGKDHGYLWRMNSYWSLEETKGGIIVECRSISLSRDVPFGLDIIIGPIINKMPRESLESVLDTLQARLTVGSTDLTDNDAIRRDFPTPTAMSLRERNYGRARPTITVQPNIACNRKVHTMEIFTFLLDQPCQFRRGK